LGPEPGLSARTALIVLGMHRSGTSAVTRVLGLLGAALPKQPMLSLKNEDHWEPERLVRLHEAMLEEAGSRWDDWRAFDPASLGKRLDHYKSRIKTILADEYADAQLMVIKDPRMCRFVPLYKDVLAELDITPRFVLLQRNPLAVTASLRRRNRMTRGFAGLLWLRHVLDASESTRGHPRCFVSYETFLDDWREAAGRAATELAIEWPGGDTQAAADIDSYLSRDLQHHAASVAELDGDPQVNGWIKEVYHALLQLERGKSAEAIAKLDRIKAEFETQTAVFGEATLPELAERERSLNEEIDRAVEWGSPKSVARRAWIQVKQVIKDVYESLPLPPLK
jgi:hypothetical protein